jgi:hypothetical protein
LKLPKLKHSKKGFENSWVKVVIKIQAFEKLKKVNLNTKLSLKPTLGCIGFNTAETFSHLSYHVNRSAV